jgi:hypothetical protein
MSTNNSKHIVAMIRKGDLDINVQDLFLSIVIKGLLLNLRNDIKIRNKSVPHYIMHTGDDRMFLEHRGYDASIEPLTISNENNIYDITPKCIVNPSNIDLDTSQLTSPYSLGSLQYEYNGGDLTGLYALKGEFRRLPMKINFELKYYVDSYTDMLELIQYILSNLAFVRTYDIMYMGQKIKCSYKIPDSFSDEHTMDIDGSFQDPREHTLSISVEVETNIPIYNNRTIVSADNIIDIMQYNIDAVSTNKLIK